MIFRCQLLRSLLYRDRWKSDEKWLGRVEVVELKQAKPELSFSSVFWEAPWPGCTSVRHTQAKLLGCRVSWAQLRLRMTLSLLKSNYKLNTAWGCPQGEPRETKPVETSREDVSVLMNWGFLGSFIYSTEGLGLQSSSDWVLPSNLQNCLGHHGRTDFSHGTTITFCFQNELEMPTERLCLAIFCIVLFCLDFPSSARKTNSFLVSSVFGAV